MNRSNFASSLAEEPQPSLIDSYIHRLSAIVHGYWSCEKLLWNKPGLSPKFTVFFRTNRDILVHFVKRRPLIVFEHFEFLLEDSEMMAGLILIVSFLLHSHTLAIDFIDLIREQV